MIVSHRHQFIFIKTRKTAGTSLEIALSEHCGPDDIITPIDSADETQRQELGFRGPQNLTMPARGLSLNSSMSAMKQRRLPQFHNHVSASVVRRALGRRVWNSYFKFTIERNPFDKAVSRYWWGTRNNDPRPSIEDYLTRVPRRMLSDWELYTIDDRIAVDYVVRYERLDEGLSVLADRLGLQLTLPPSRAKGGYRADRRPVEEVLTPLSAARIEQTCWRELAAFAYVRPTIDKRRVPIQYEALEVGSFRNAAANSNLQRAPM